MYYGSGDWELERRERLKMPCGNLGRLDIQRRWATSRRRLQQSSKAAAMWPLASSSPFACRVLICDLACMSMRQCRPSLGRDAKVTVVHAEACDHQAIIFRHQQASVMNRQAS